MVRGINDERAYCTIRQFFIRKWKSIETFKKQPPYLSEKGAGTTRKCHLKVYIDSFLPMYTSKANFSARYIFPQISLVSNKKTDKRNYKSL